MKDDEFNRQVAETVRSDPQKIRLLSRISPSWRLEPWNRDHVTYHVIAGGPCARPLKTLRAPRTPVNLDLPSLVLN